MEPFFQDWPPLARSAAVAAGVVLAALLAHALVYRGYAALGRRRPSLLFLGGSLLSYTRGPMRLLLPILGLYAAYPLIGAGLPEGLAGPAQDVLYVLLVAAIAWLLIGLTAMVNVIVARHYVLDADDNLLARKVRTQADILRRILIVGIVVLALGRC